MAINLKDTVQIIRGKKTDIAARTGANGELNWADDTYELYIHDGKTRGGHLIGKASGTAGVVGGAGIAVSTSDGISTVSVKRDPSNVLYATTDGAGVRIGTSGALQITAQNALDLRVAEGGGIIVDSSGVKIDSAVLSSVFRYAGQVNSVDDLPSDAQPGDVYDVKDSGANYVWSGTSWDNLGGILSVDSSPTQGSTNPVASGGVYDAIQDVKLSGDGTTVTVTNNIISVPEYEGATADTAATSGLVPPAAAGEQDKVLRGDGEWGEYLPTAGGNMTGKISSTANTVLEHTDSNVSIADTSRPADVNELLVASLDKDGKRGGGVEVSYAEEGYREMHFTMRNRTDTGWIIFGVRENVDGSSVGVSPNPNDNSDTNDIATTAWVRDRIAEIDFPSEVTLSDSVTSTSSTTAASSMAVKTAYDKAVEAASAANSAQSTAKSALSTAQAAFTREAMIGMITPFACTNLPEGWMICDGSSVLFSDWPEFQQVYNEGRFTGMTLSAADPAQKGKFVLNGSTGVYLPDLEGLFVQASAAGTAGAYVAPGLPNIKGSNINYLDIGYAQPGDGALSATVDSSVLSGTDPERDYNSSILSFSASAYNSIYSDSVTTVQPPSVQYVMAMYLGKPAAAA